MSNWILTNVELSPQGEVVETISPSGMQQNLKLQGRLWFFPDGSMHVYYEPKFWRRREEGK